MKGNHGRSLSRNMEVVTETEVVEAYCFRKAAYWLAHHELLSLLSFTFSLFTFLSDLIQDHLLRGATVHRGWPLHMTR